MSLEADDTTHQTSIVFKARCAGRQYPLKKKGVGGLCGQGEECGNAVGCCYNERVLAGRRSSSCQPAEVFSFSPTATFFFNISPSRAADRPTEPHHTPINFKES